MKILRTGTKATVAVVFILVGTTCSAQGKLTDAEFKLVLSLGSHTKEECRARPPIASIHSGSGAFSYDNERVCSCMENKIVAGITPEVLHRDSGEEGAALKRDALTVCRAIEYVAAFSRDCPALSKADDSFKENHPNASSAASYCRCVTAAWNKQSADDLYPVVRAGFVAINAAREAQTLSLNLLFVDAEEETAVACGRRPRRR